MKKLLPFFILGVPIIILYMNSVGYGFIAIDDGNQVLDNVIIHELTGENLKSIFTTDTIKMYQPLTSLFFAFIIALFGFKTATAFHVFSISVHIINTFLVYILGKRLFSNRINPYLIPLLFALHPLAVEAVSWVSATSTVLFSCFFLMATIQYDRYLELNKRKYYVYSILLFLLGCFSKVQIIPFVGILFLLDYLRGEKLIDAKRILSKIPFVTIALIFLFIGLSFRQDQSGFSGDYNPIYLVPSQLAWYIYKSFVPIKLGIVYDWPEQIKSSWFFVSIGIVIAVGYLSFAMRKNKLFVFGILFFLSNIILHTTFFTKFLSPFADRYGYLSTLGIWIALFSLVEQKQKRTVSIIGVLVLGLFFGMAKVQTTYWKDTITLWSNNLKHQKSTFSNGMRGNLYYEKKMYAEAKRDFEKVDQKPDYRFEPEKYGYLYGSLGMMTTESDPEKSAEYFSKAASLYPTLPNMENAGKAYQKIKSYDTAEAYYLHCLKTNKNPRFYMNLSSLYYEMKRFDKGMYILTQAIDSGLEEAIFYKMRCVFRIEERQFELAADDFKKAKKLLQQSNHTDPDPILTTLEGVLRNYL
ncbi:hypothetical protein L0P88_03865 [Muricauda sp. SCSIO 64092]|uniref:hypothetical protein n=1 Tax=Allomuricauda sp. SCSIO 64092 TaxID=2908842 RepID=UPI001FF2DF92|nr:hypothetical protein [Muricauda sp. SCSIO 64092]UOY07693.1 hypothetical protein L0P88_03865 [Muricauda sp. SCSIO 64092]